MDFGFFATFRQWRRVKRGESSCRLRIIASRQGAKRDGKIRVIIREITRCPQTLDVLSPRQTKNVPASYDMSLLGGKLNFGKPEINMKLYFESSADSVQIEVDGTARPSMHP